jgi:hypothetical protein
MFHLKTKKFWKDGQKSRIRILETNLFCRFCLEKEKYPLFPEKNTVSMI